MYAEMMLGVASTWAGTILAARVSDASAAGLAISNQIYAIVFVMFRVIGAGTSVVVTQRLGANQPLSARAAAFAALGGATWFGGFAAALLLAFAPALVGVMRAPDTAVPYLMALAPTLVIDSWSACMASVLRVHLRAVDTLAVIVTTHALNLMFVLLLMPHWGLVGYAGSLFASHVIGFALYHWLWRVRLGLRPVWHDWWRVPRAELAAILHLGIPGAAEAVSWRLCYAVSLSVAGTLSVHAQATHAYVMQILHVVLTASVSLGLACEIVVGRLVGAGELRRAHRLVERCLGLGILLALVMCGAAAVVGPTLMSYFTHDPEIIETGCRLLWLSILLETGRSFNVIVIDALRAAGDARFPVVAGLAPKLLVLALGSWFLAVPMGAGLAGIWIAYAADEWIRGLSMWWRWRQLAWVPHARITRWDLARHLAATSQTG